MNQRVLNLLSRRETGVFLLLLFATLIVTMINPLFVSTANLRDLLIAAAPTLITACGLMLVMVMGEIDISIGSLMGFCAAICGLMATRWGASPAEAALLTLGIGVAVGLINGILVTFGRVPSIIATLGMLSLLRGATEVLMGGEWITSVPAELRWLGTGTLLGVPVPVAAAVITLCATAVLVYRTPAGRRIYAAGSNPDAAHAVGLPVRNLKLLVFVITGLLSAVAALVKATRLDVIESGFGAGTEMLIVTCVVVGGTSVSGGRGTLTGVTFGVLLLSAIGTMLIFMKLGVSATYWERAIQGAFILLAVLADHLARRRHVGGAA